MSERSSFALAIRDSAFDAALCTAAAAAWPPPDWSGWHAVYDSAQQKKRACNRWEDMPQPCRRLLAEMLCLDVSGFGLGHLVADTGLWGGGMHDMASGDVLAAHLDADTHRLSGLRRRLNAILFLTSGWREEWGGALELWDASQRYVTTRVFPAFARLVLFASTNESWHSVSRLTCPASLRRMTLACWWYGAPTSERGQREHALFAE